MSYLTLDIGTTNWKASVFSRECKPICTVKHPARLTQGDDGFSYYDPVTVWQSIVDMLRNIHAEFPLARLEAVCVTSMGEAVVPIDCNGHPLFSIIPWFDGRSILQADLICSTIGDNRIFEITGTKSSPIYSLPKILWMREHYPQVFYQAKKWLQMSDYINYRLCGRFVTDPSLACRTLAFDLKQCRWSQEMLTPFDLEESLFPEVVPSGTVIGTVTSSTAAETGLPVGLPVVLGGHDHPVASIAGAVFQSNTVFDSSGTAEPFLCISEPNQPLTLNGQRHRCTRHPIPDRYINWGGIVSSGVCVDWAVQRFTSYHDFTQQQVEQSYDALFHAATALPPGSQGLLFHPALRGSGAPQWDARSKGAFLGLTADHTSLHLLRAVLEGLCYQARQLVEMHQQISGRTIDTICCMGGGSRISLWQQIKADVTGCVVQAGKFSDATPLGAAILCAYAQSGESLEKIARQMKPEFQIFEPDPKRYSIYQDYYDLYQTTCDLLIQANHRLDMLNRR